MISDYFSGKRLEKVWNDYNWVFQIILDHFGGKSAEQRKLLSEIENKLFLVGSLDIQALH